MRDSYPEELSGRDTARAWGNFKYLLPLNERKAKEEKRKPWEIRQIVRKVIKKKCRFQSPDIENKF